MTSKSLADRVAALEAKVGSKSIQEQFREQAELIDRLFTYRFEEYDKKMDVKLAALEDRLEARLEAKLETRLEAKLETKLEAKLETKLETKLEAKLEQKLEAKLEQKLEQKLETKLDQKLETKLDQKLEQKLDQKLETKLEPIRSDLAFVKDSVQVILDRLA